jgi:tRNA 2-selenouridine synthase
MLPGRPQPAQKRFESLVLHELARLDPGRRVLVEGESKKIGQLQVPEALIARMRAADCVLLDTAPGVRVELLIDEYRHFLADRPSLERQLDCLAALHGRDKIASWKALAGRGAWEELVARLLAEHYDPAYRRSSARNFARLPQARLVRIESAAERSFRDAALALAEEAVAA